MRQFESRINMLSLVKKRGAICELGVFRGDFSEIILAVCNPKEFILIDSWQEGSVRSGDANGNNVEEFDGDFLHEFVVNRFKHAPQVKTIRKLSTKAIRKFPDNYFDLAYIDADHTYEGVKADLELAYRKVKHNGLIMGHDYELNTRKTSAKHVFGTKRAVDEFCTVYSQSIYAKARDGCVSYCIKLRKKDKEKLNKSSIFNNRIRYGRIKQ